MGKVRRCWFRASLVLGLALSAWENGALAEPAAVLVEKERLVQAQPRGEAWRDAPIGLELATRARLRTGEYSRAAVRFSDLSMLRLDELVEMEITAAAASPERTLELRRGGAYFFSREKPAQMQIRTAAANGALRGTEFALRVAADGRTTLAMFEGEVELANPQGRLLVRSGEVAEVVVGGAPRRTAVIDARNLVQWCLYYPAVLEPEALGLASASVARAYAAGDLPGALQALPRFGENAALSRAAIILSSGQVARAQAELRRVPARDPGRSALERMIAAVQGRDTSGFARPQTPSEWLAESYVRQARHDLEGAREAAWAATKIAHDFGFAWARLGELEFSFGRLASARTMAERALQLAPRHAQAHALRGFIFAAENRHDEAARCFDTAMTLDPALGNAWLGRGLIAIRQGDELTGRRHLQTAAVLEPRRSVLRSYLGKALSQTGSAPAANVELERAAALDPADPTPPLYTAILRQQENRLNEGIAALERSLDLNDQRRVYRSQFLLDQDRAIRSANLAAIYRQAGLESQSIREAVRAVASDYASAPAHLFLANSFNALRDPTRVQLRYEPAWFNELLLANLLSPVGGGSLSQFVSEQEYSKLFEKDGPHLSLISDYRSDGQVRVLGSQFGTFGNVSYALDAEYFYDDGVRANNDVSRFEAYGTFKLQLGLHDSVFLQVKYQDFSSGDVFQRYDPLDAERTVNADGTVTPNVPGRTFDFRERQEPGLLLAGWHHEWAPGHHTLLLLGRLSSDDAGRIEDAPVRFLLRDASPFVAPDLALRLFDGLEQRDAAFFRQMRAIQDRTALIDSGEVIFDLESSQRFTTWHGELQHIATLDSHTLVLGARFQRGEFEAESRLSDFSNGTNVADGPAFPTAELSQRVSVDFDRVSFYAYDYWRPASWLTLTAGVSYDSIDFPLNTTLPPISDADRGLDAVSPKLGAIVQPWRGGVIRAAYAEGLGGASFDESVRLEPTQVAGFLQSYRSLISESLLGTVSGSEFRSTGVSLEQRLPTRTYLGVEWRALRQDVDRTEGAFDSLTEATLPLANLLTGVTEQNRYREDSLLATVQQLLGDCWTLGAEYRFTRAHLEQQLAGFDDALDAQLRNPFAVAFGRDALGRLLAADREREADLHQLQLYAIYNHRSGFFARAEADWYRQDLSSPAPAFDFTAVDAGRAQRPRVTTVETAPPGDDFWQFHVSAGWRFLQNRCEVSAGVLNLTDEDYRLDPLTPYLELPRERTFFVRCRLNF